MDLHGRWLLLAILPWCLVPAFAGAPLLNETCLDRENKPVPTRYDPAATRFFAEARVLSATERREGLEKGVPPAAIYVNPELYFLGQQTQQWLFLRQCIHIQRDHLIAKAGERGLRPEDEEQADCLALRELTRSPSQSSSMRTLRASIESDMERVLREDRWRQVLPGPQRRISFDKCPG
ncbi:hypothetical protein [Piscinibacter sp.]|uniref:hypothetical protein n=1 Tax=Piscinibacter sp. TaxID=1903157 RepID=UPI00355AB643